MEGGRAQNPILSAAGAERRCDPGNCGAVYRLCVDEGYARGSEGRDFRVSVSSLTSRSIRWDGVATKAALDAYLGAGGSRAGKAYGITTTVPQRAHSVSRDKSPFHGAFA
jgi:hypothetical protein